MKIRFRKIFRWFLGLAAVYIVVVTALYFFQENLIFHPEKVSSDQEYSFKQPHNSLLIPVSPGNVQHILQFPSEEISKGIVLYFPGNAGHAALYKQQAAFFTGLGYDFWITDHPGFGKSTGDLNENNINDYALRTYRVARAIYSPDSIIIYGRSLGSAAASGLAARRDCKRLILEAPIYNMKALATRHYPIFPGFLLKYNFPNDQYLQKVTAPITVFHGTADRTIPFKHSLRFRELGLRDFELVPVPDGLHNNVDTSAIYNRFMRELLSD